VRLITNTSGRFALRAKSTVAPTARRSCGDGCTGTSTRSASPTTSATTGAAAGGVSISTSEAPAFLAAAKAALGVLSATTMTGVSASLASHHKASPRIGSRSMTATGPAPARAASTAKSVAMVVLPAPPLREAITMVCMGVTRHQGSHVVK
jgi:hypothetical protein